MTSTTSVIRTLPAAIRERARIESVVLRNELTTGVVLDLAQWVEDEWIPENIPASPAPSGDAIQTAVSTF